MEYTCFPGMVLDGPLMEDRSICSSASTLGTYQQVAYNSHFPAVSWSTTDPTLLVTEPVWFNRPKVPYNASNIDMDASRGQSSFQQQHPDVIHNHQLNLPGDMMTTISSDSFSMGGDVATHAQWMQMCSLISDQYYNDAMPQLISDSAAPHPCMYSPTSDCLHEADSSGSSERERPLSRSCLAGSSPEEINWRNSDMLQGNLGISAAGLCREDESSSVGADGEIMDASGHPLSLISMHRTGVDSIPMTPVSWIGPCAAELDSRAMVTSVVNHFTTLDPVLGPASMQSLTSCNGLSLPYKRQRACYTLENIPSKSLSQPLIPPLSQTISPRSSDFTPTSLNQLNGVDSLYKDFHFASRHLMSPSKPAVHEVGGGFGSKRDLDHDTTSIHRKHIATSIEPQSVAARHRRKKISERVRVLEKLIPGGNKMDTASMLDEAIEYVKFLQLQVQLLESLGEIPDGSSSTSAVFHKETMGGVKDAFAQRMGCFGSHVSLPGPTLQQPRPATSPLILSEVLQQQLFKQKLCLVSLRQCPTVPRCLASGS